MTLLQCPKCRSIKWNAVEQFQALTPCTIEYDSDGVSIEMDSSAELSRDAATSVILAYTCDNCSWTMKAYDAEKVGEDGRIQGS